MDDFNNLLKIERKFWEIDSVFLREKLIVINSNSKVQTLYSKYGIQGPDDSVSYLEFAFSKDVELKIFRSILPDMLFRFNSIGMEESNCYYQYSEPRTNDNYQSKSDKFGMGCVDDKDYFNLNTIKIQMDTYDPKIKTEFWNDLTIALSELT